MSFLRSIIADARSSKAEAKHHIRQQLAPSLPMDASNSSISETAPAVADSVKSANSVSTNSEISADAPVLTEAHQLQSGKHEAAGNQSDKLHPSDAPYSPNIAETTTESELSFGPLNTFSQARDIEYQVDDIEPIQTESTHAGPDDIAESTIVQDEPAPAIASQQRQSHDQTEVALQAPSAITQYEHDTQSRQTDSTLTEAAKKPLHEKRFASTESGVDGTDKAVSEARQSEDFAPPISSHQKFENTQAILHTAEKMNQVSSAINPENRTAQNDLSSIKKKTVSEKAVIYQTESEAVQHSDSPSTVKQASTSPLKPDTATSEPNSPDHDTDRRAILPEVSTSVLRNEPGFRASYAPPEKRRSTPEVQIGQIDVIIEMPAKPAPRPAAVSSDHDLGSSHYLRRL